MKDYKYHDLTPIEEHERILFKRDDLYDPFGDFAIRGGKVRQCLFLVESNLEHIRGEYGGVIATAASVHSPQAVIVARVAKEFGLGCIIGHGAKDPLKHSAMRMCVDLGAELVTLCTNNAYNNVLYGKLKELNKKRLFFTINFGYQAATNPEAIIDMNANQVKNLPDDLRMLVINVGSGVSAAGILAGVEKYKPYLFEKKDRLHLIQPFGYDRREVISAHLDFGKQYRYHQSKYAYHTPLSCDIGTIHLDEIYEAKAFDYMSKFIVTLEDAKRHKICYWIIGDSNALRA